VWNITLITLHFNYLNIKLNAENNKILEENYTSLLSLRSNP